MTSALRTPMSLDAFLAWEREQGLRFEFDGVRAVAITGDTVAHSEIGTLVVDALRRLLKGGPCRALRGDLKVIANGRVRYPDSTITCVALGNQSDIAPDPAVVFEIISPGTASVDRTTKNEECRQTPSIRHYVILEQTTIAATVFSRRGDA